MTGTDGDEDWRTCLFSGQLVWFWSQCRVSLSILFELYLKFYFLLKNWPIIVPKTFSDWTNLGECDANHDTLDCGPGTQMQKRTCTNGEVDMCAESEETRTVSCSVAGSELPTCTGIFLYISGINISLTLVIIIIAFKLIVWWFSFRFR